MSVKYLEHAQGNETAPTDLLAVLAHGFANVDAGEGALQRVGDATGIVTTARTSAGQLSLGTASANRMRIDLFAESSFDTSAAPSGIAFAAGGASTWVKDWASVNSGHILPSVSLLGLYLGYNRNDLNTLNIVSVGNIVNILQSANTLLSKIYDLEVALKFSNESSHADAKSARQTKLRALATAIEQFGQRPNNWDGIDGVAPGREAREDARAFLARLPAACAPPESVYAPGDGEILFQWRTSQGFAEVAFAGDRTVSWYVRPADGDALFADDHFERRSGQAPLALLDVLRHF